MNAGPGFIFVQKDDAVRDPGTTIRAAAQSKLTR